MEFIAVTPLIPLALRAPQPPGILTKRGYIVTSYSTAEAAIDAYHLLFYPLLFLDLFLPGMDGFSFCRWVRSQPEGDRHLILVGTSSDSQTDLQKIVEAGADDYIIKRQL